MKSKPNQVGPATSGPRPAANRITGKFKKQTSNSGTSGARSVGKDSANVHDSRRDNQPLAWARKTKGHRDQAQAVRDGGSVN